MRTPLRKVASIATTVVALGLAGYGAWFAWAIGVAGPYANLLWSLPLVAWVVSVALGFVASRMSGARHAMWGSAALIALGVGLWLCGQRVRTACGRSCYDGVSASGQAMTCPPVEREPLCRALFFSAYNGELGSSRLCAEFPPQSCRSAEP